MDRRTLLAFLLIFIVITGYQLLMSHEAQKHAGTPATRVPAAQEIEAPSRTDGVDPVAVVDERPSAGSDWSANAELSFVGDQALEPANRSAAERRVTVATPLYEVELAGRGARITSWSGLEFPGADGRPVQLIPQGDESVPYGSGAVVFDATEMELGRLVFETDAPARLDVSRGTQTVVFRLRTAGDLEVRKIYTFDADTYEIALDLELAAAGPQASAARAHLGLPRRARFGWAQGIASTEERDRLEEASFRSFAGVGDGLDFKKRGSAIKNVDKVSGVFEGDLRFAGVQNKYFTIVGLPAQDPDTPPHARVVLSGDRERNLQTWTIERAMLPQRAGSDALASSRLILYLGPQEADRLKAFGVGLDKTMELGWALFRPVTEATLWIMAQMRRVIPNYGVIIILFSVLTKVAFYPLTRTSTQSMKRMQQLQPKIKELQEKYKDNREKQSQEMMKLYKKEKINPMAGCLPLLLQMPVFIALYQALAHTIALRNTPFVAWIDDLSKPDALFTMPFSLPFLGPDFNLLPLLMTATMVVQMRMTPTGTAPAQMAMMNTVMPVIFLFFFYQMPSGLVLYWLVNNVVTIYQTWRIHKTATPEGGSKTS